jgi:hypothetical protein
MSRQWDFEEVLSELADIAQLLKSRSDSSDLSERLVSQWMFKLAKCQFDTAKACKLQKTLDCTDVPQQMKDKIQASVDELLLSPTDDTPMKGGQWPTQKHIFIHNYLTASKWQALDDATGPWAAKVQVLVSTLRDVGVNYCHEQTVKWCIALLVAMQAERMQKLPRYADIFVAVGDFKSAFHSCPSKCKSKVQDYPSDPTTLPPELYQKLCSGDEKPINRDILRLAQTADNHIPLRKDSKLLKQEAEKEAKEAKETREKTVLGSLAGPDALQHLLQMLSNASNSSSGAPSLSFEGLNNAGAIGFKPSVNRKPVPMLASDYGSTADTQGRPAPALAPAIAPTIAVHGPPALALPAPEADEAPEAPEAPEVPGAPVAGLQAAPREGTRTEPTAAVEMSSEDYEKAAFEALVGRPSKKAAKMKRPAASDGRPGTRAKLTGGDDYTTLDIGIPCRSDAAEYSSRGSYTSKYSHKARKEALPSGLLLEIAKKIASGAYKAAAEAWDAAWKH